MSSILDAREKKKRQIKTRSMPIVAISLTRVNIEIAFVTIFLRHPVFELGEVSVDRYSEDAISRASFRVEMTK